MLVKFYYRMNETCEYAIPELKYLIEILLSLAYLFACVMQKRVF